MTVLVGVRCTDGVIIGADSAVTYSPVSDPNFYTAEAASGRKVYVVHNEIVVATTGEVGLGQRLVRFLQDALSDQNQRNDFLNAPPANAGTWISQNATANFKQTLAPWERSYNLGALVGVVVQNEPRLYWFDQQNFRPELVGERDETGQFRTLPLITHGGGQKLADPFLLHAHRVLFGEGHFPDVGEGRLLVAWTLDHVIRYNVGGVGGAQCIVALERHNDGWQTAEVDVDEMNESVKDIENHIRAYEQPKPEDAGLDLHAELDGNGGGDNTEPE